MKNGETVLISAAGAGVASVIIAPAIISAIGFGSGGIVAGSAAAGMMSAAAIAGGGSVAAGSAVAILQSAGAVGIFGGPIGWSVLLVYGALGAGIAATVACFVSGRSDGRRFTGIGSPLSKGKWNIGTEEGIGNVRLYVFEDEKTAWEVYHSLWVSRILWNDKGVEVASFGLAVDNVRRVIGEYTLAEQAAMNKMICGPLAGCIVAFKTRHGRFLSAHPDFNLKVENDPDAWETFRLCGIEGQINSYAARSVCNSKRFIQMVDDRWSVEGSEFGTSNQILSFEKSNDNDDAILIRSALNGKYMSVTDEHCVLAIESITTLGFARRGRALVQELQDFEKFQILIL